jgi:hypothetical protein
MSVARKRQLSERAAKIKLVEDERYKYMSPFRAAAIKIYPIPTAGAMDWKYARRFSRLKSDFLIPN